MNMPNPSTIAAELHQKLAFARRAYGDLSLSKASREHHLRVVRQLEAELDLPEDERTPPHNQGGKHDPSPTEGSVLTLADMQLVKQRLRDPDFVLPYMDVGLIVFALQAGNEDQRKLAEHLLRK
jgi:hypothetical protein